MSFNPLAPIKHDAKMNWWIQLICTLLLAMGFAFLNFKSAYSVVLGGLCWLLPSLIFIWFFFRDFNTRHAARIVINMYLGELLKFLISAVLIIISLKFLSIVVLPFVYGYIVAIMTFWVGPLIRLIKKRAQ